LLQGPTHIADWEVRLALAEEEGEQCIAPLLLQVLTVDLDVVDGVQYAEKFRADGADRRTLLARFQCAAPHFTLLALQRPLKEDGSLFPVADVGLQLGCEEGVVAALLFPEKLELINEIGTFEITPTDRFMVLSKCCSGFA